MVCYSFSPNVTECNSVNISSRKKTKIAPAVVAAQILWLHDRFPFGKAHFQAGFQGG